MLTELEAPGRLAEVLAVLGRTTQGPASRGVPAEREQEAEELLAALSSLRALRDTLSAWEPLLIETARDRGVSWHRLAPVLGVTSRQAAERRYLRTRPNADDSLTREQRVQAARDERAGDRAVAVWAHANAEELRGLAGQLSGLTGLSARGRRQVEQLRRVLFAAEPAEPADLLAPLAEMQSHLTKGAEHARLAERISAVGLAVTRVRTRTQEQRDAG